MFNGFDFKQLLNGKNIKFKLVRDSIGSLILRAFYILFTFILGIVLVRSLGVKNWGVFSYIFSIISILILPAEFGLPILVLRETSSNVASKNWEKVKGLWDWAGRIIAILTVIIGLVAFIGILIFGEFVSQVCKTTFLLGLILMLLLSFTHLRGAQLMGLKKVVLGQLSEQALVPGILILLVLLDSQFLRTEILPQKAMVLRIIATGISLIISTLLWKRFIPKQIRNTLPVNDGKFWLASALPLAMINGINRINNEASLLILGLFVNSSEVGYYKAAVNFSILASFALQVINTVVAPHFASMYTEGDMKRLQKLVTISARLALMINILITSLLFFFGRQILSLAYGQSFVISYLPLIILLVGQCINSAVGSVGYLLNMTQKEKFVIKGISVATIINIILNFAFSPRFGMIGAAISTSISMMVSNIYFWVVVRKQLGINSLFIRYKENSEKK